MASASDTLQTLFDNTQTKPAIIADDKYKKACNSHLAQDLRENYLAPAVNGSSAPKDETNMERVENMSRTNFKVMHRLAQQTIADATAAFGAKTVNAVVAAAEKHCQTSEIALTHTPIFDNTSHGDDAGKSDILRDKALKAPSVLSKDPDDDTMIYLHAIPKNEHDRKYNISFKLSNVPKAEFQRSLIHLSIISTKGNDSNHVSSRSVGGNHLREAWVMATVQNMLHTMLQTKEITLQADLDELGEKTKIHAISSISEIRVPLEMSLVGHHMIEDGVATEIVSSRAKPKSLKPEPKRSIEPTSGNDDLKRKPRVRGKASDE